MVKLLGDSGGWGCSNNGSTGQLEPSSNSGTCLLVVVVVVVVVAELDDKMLGCTSVIIHLGNAVSVSP